MRYGGFLFVYFISYVMMRATIVVRDPVPVSMLEQFGGTPTMRTPATWLLRVGGGFPLFEKIGFVVLMP